MKLLPALLLLAACAPDRDRGVVLWHAYAGGERAALEGLGAEWNATHPDTPLTLVAVPYDAFADKLTSAIPNGNGPDLFIYAHDRIGSWEQANLIEPIEFWVDEELADRFDRAAIDPLAYDGSLWGLPLATKCLALYYRTDLVATPPRTTDELLAMPRDRYPLAYVGSELYGHMPWLAGFGGEIFTADDELHVASAEAVAAAGFVRRLVAERVTPEEVTAPTMATLFNEGEVEMALSGPWFTGDLAATTPWAVTTLPIVSETGLPAAPFLSAEGVLMSARARDKDAAFAVMSFLTDDAAAIRRAHEAHQVVANRAAYDDAEIAADQTLAAFRAQAAHTVAMPATPAMRAVWRPYQIALQGILRGADPGDALHDVEREVTQGP